jgi:hypothetical protein
VVFASAACGASPVHSQSFIPSRPARSLLDAFLALSLPIFVPILFYLFAPRPNLRHKTSMASQAVVNAFFVLWMWPSHLALPILVATVLFARPKIERHPAFVNMCITEILGGIAMSIL